MITTTSHKALYVMRTIIATTLLAMAVVITAPAQPAWAAGTIVKDEQALKTAVANGGTVTVEGTVQLAATLDVTKSVTLTGSGTIDASKISGKGDVPQSAIKVSGKDAKLTLDGPTITGGKGTVLTSEGMEPRGDHKFRVGGGIYVEEGELIFKSGTITGNTAQRGGGIFVGRTVVKEKNDVEKTTKLGKLTMTGGSVTGNNTVDKNTNDKFAGEGGGIFVYGEATISGGSITGNTCNSQTDLGGGGLYINNHGKATLVNATITSNTAYGFGGGIAGCCHGEMSIVATDGVALYGNTAKGIEHTDGDQPKGGNAPDYKVAEIIDGYNAATKAGIKAENSKDFYTAGSCIVSNYMAGGGSAKYEVTVKNSTKSLEDNDVEKYEKTNVALVAHPSAESINKVPDGVVISGNTSKVHGGGIGCNGGLYFGSKEDQTIEYDILKLQLNANKELQGEKLQADQFAFELLYDDKNTVVSTTKNTSEGNISFSINDYSELKAHNLKSLGDEKYQIIFYLREVIPHQNANSITYDQSMYQIVAILKATTETRTETLPHTTGNNDFNNIKVTYKETTYTLESSTISVVQDKAGNPVEPPAAVSGTPTFTNAYKGSLTINKELVGGGEKAASQAYTFDVTGPDGYSESVTVKGNGSATLKDLAPGTYTIKERSAELDGYEWTCNVNGTEGDTGTVVVAGGSNEATVTNTYKELGSLTIKKTVNDQDDVAKDKVYTFTVTGPGKDGPQRTVSVTGQGTVYIPDLDPGEYFVEEADASIAGYEWVVSYSGEITIAENGGHSEVPVTNTYTKPRGSLTINKAIVAPEGCDTNRVYTFNVTGPDGYSEVVTINGQGSYTLDNLVPGVYTVTEDVEGAQIKDYTLTVSGDNTTATVEPNGNAEATITNTYSKTNPGELIISKAVVAPEGVVDPQKTFTFNVSGPEGFTARTVVVKAGESVTLKDLPVGQYTVTEVREGAEVEGYALTVTGESTAQVSADKGGNVTITNTYTKETGSLILHKIVKGGSEAQQDATYTFIVTGPTGSGYENGKEVEVKAGQSTKLSDLIPGEYYVSEKDASAKGFTYKVDGEGTYIVGANGEKNVTITNTYTEALGSLSIKKALAEGAPQAAKDQTYKVTVTGPDGFSQEVDIKAGETKVLTDLLPGTYNVTEANAGIKDWGWTVDGTGDVTVVANNEASVTVTNAYTQDKGSLVLQKLVAGEQIPAGAEQQSYTFRVTNTNIDYDQTFSVPAGQKVTIKDLLPGQYNVSEIRDGAEVEGYALVVTGEGPVTVEPNAQQDVTITNTYTQELGSLTITKAIAEGAPAEAATKTYTFVIDGPSCPAPDVKNVTITGANSVTVDDLLPGTYTVSEVGGEISDWIWNVSGQGDVTVKANEEATMTVTNTYTQDFGSLALTKKLDGAIPEGATEKSYEFEVTGPNGYSQKFSVRADETVVVDKLVPGQYSVREIVEGAQFDGYAVQVTGEQTVVVTPKGQPSVTITNTYTQDTGSLSLTKVLAEGAPQEAQDKVYTLIVTGPKGTPYEDGVSVDIKAGETQVLEDLLPGVYTVTEAQATIEDWGWTVEGTGDVTVEAKSQASATVTNTYTQDVGHLVLEKVVAGAVPAGAGEKSYDFRVTNDSGYDQTFSVPAGQQVVVNDLVPGQYNVSEIKDGAVVEDYALVVTGEGPVQVTSNTEQHVTITNTYTQDTGSLSVTKAVAEGAPQTALNKTYTLTLTGPEGTPYAKGVDFELKAGETKTFEDLLPGTYSVSEKDASITGWHWSVAGEGNVTVEANKSANATVTNTYTQMRGALIINKAVVDPDGVARGKSFTFNVSGPNGFSIQVVLEAGQSYELDNLVPGTYTITEENAEVEGHKLTVTGNQTVTVAAGGVSETTITNTYTNEKPGSLILSKALVDPEGVAQGKNFTFDIAGPDGYSTTVVLEGGKSQEIDGLKPGTYTVTERDSSVEGTNLIVDGEGPATVDTTAGGTVTVTNTYARSNGSLTIHKVVMGGGEEAATKVYSFVVTGPNGFRREIQITGEGTQVLRDLEPGSYTVTERDATIEGLSWSVSGQGSVEVTQNANPSVTVTNTYAPEEELFEEPTVPLGGRGSLTLNKLVIGGGEEAATKTYTFTVTNGLGFSQTVTVTGTGSVTLNNLPVGQYTVREQDAQIEGYTLQVSGEGTATITPDSSASLSITNRYSSTTPGDDVEIPDGNVPLANVPNTGSTTTTSTQRTQDQTPAQSSGSDTVELSEGGVPLGSYPAQGQTDDTVDIFDDAVPLGGYLPKTGDTLNFAIVAAVAIVALSAAAIGFMLLHSKKNS